MVAVTFIERAAIFIGESVTFIEGAVMFIRGTVVFIGKGGSAIGRSFKITGVGVGDIRGVNKYNLRR